MFMIEVLKKNQINLDSKDNYCTCFHVFPGPTDNALYNFLLQFTKEVRDFMQKEI